MIIINTTIGESHHIHDETLCTRYCHDKGCSHYERDVNNNSIFRESAEKVYKKNIQLLHQNGMGLSYAEANLLIYVILIPFFIAILLWGIIRKGKHG